MHCGTLAQASDLPLGDGGGPLTDGVVDAALEIDESPNQMKFSIASVTLFVLASVTFAIRGAADWSQSFAVAWYGVFGVAVLLGLAAVAVALESRGPGGKRRAMIVVLAFPALIAVPVLIALVIVLAPLAN